MTDVIFTNDFNRTAAMPNVRLMADDGSDNPVYIEVNDLLDRATGIFVAQNYAAQNYTLGGGADDYPAISAAIAAATAGGGVVLLPPTTMALSHALTIPSGVTLMGSGMATVLRPTATMPAMINLLSGGATVQDVLLYNQGNLATSGVLITKPYDNVPLDLMRVYTRGFLYGVRVTAGDVIRMLYPWAVSCGTALRIEGGFMNSFANGVYYEDGNGIHLLTPSGGLLECEGSEFTGKIMLGPNADFGVKIEAGLELSFDKLVIDQIWKAGASGYVIGNPSSPFAIRGVKISRGWTGRNINALSTRAGILVYGDATEQLHIDQHTFDSHGTYGLEVVQGIGGLTLDLLVTGCRFKTNALGDVRLNFCRSTFIGNTMEHSTVSIMVEGSQVQVCGIGNRFVATPQSGTITGSFYMGSIGAAGNDSQPSQVVSNSGLDIHGTGVFRNDLFVEGLLHADNGLGVTGISALNGNVGVTGTIFATGNIVAANLFVGTGDPEGIIATTPGVLYLRMAASGDLSDHTLWIKESGVGNTGWRAMASQNYVSRVAIGIIGVSGTPTTSQIPSGQARLVKDTTGGSAKLYYNDGGTLKSVTLT